MIYKKIFIAVLFVVLSSTQAFGFNRDWEPDYMGLSFANEYETNLGSGESISDHGNKQLTLLFGWDLSKEWRTNLGIGFGECYEKREGKKKEGDSIGINLYLFRDFKLFSNLEAYLGIGAGFMHLSSTAGWKDIGNSGLIGSLEALAGLQWKVYDYVITAGYGFRHFSDVESGDQGHNNNFWFAGWTQEF